jgi:ELWxxDGT repeat protein
MATKRWLYVKSNENTGPELWVTDGTAEGTGLLIDLWPGPQGSNPQVVWVMDDGRAMFTANDGVNGGALWITDGTSAGTRILTEGATGYVPHAVGSGLGIFTPLGNGQALFRAYHPSYGYELWITDGSDEGTRLFKDLDQAQWYGGGYPERITALGNGHAVFTAVDVQSGQWTLWGTDGSAEGTLVLVEALPGENWFVNQIMSLGNGRALLTVYDTTHGWELWGSDGTPEGTGLLQDIWPGTNSASPSGIVPLANGLALFTAYHPEHGYEMWVSDGTAEGTSLLIDNLPGVDSSRPSSAIALGDGRALFSAYSPEVGQELWVTDGTSAGTWLLKDIALAPNGSYPQHLISLGDGRVVFTAQTSEQGPELWISDGTAEGTQLIADLWPGYSGSYPHQFISLGQGRVAFRAQEANGSEYWVSDGTAAGTVRLTSLLPAGLTPMVTQVSPNLGSTGQALMFQAVSSQGDATLWLTDGTAEGTRPVDTVEVGSAPSYPYPLAALGDGRALFAADDPVHGRELWVTDGSSEGTFLLRDIWPGTIGSSPYSLEALGNGQVLFSAYTHEQGHELWISDGSAEGTGVLKDIGSVWDSGSPSELTALGNGLVIMSAQTVAHGRELWVSNGTAEGTRLLMDMVAGPDGSYPYYPFALGDGRALFMARTDTSSPHTLWITDGTAEGTLRVAPGSLNGTYQGYGLFSALGTGKATFLVYNSATNQSELWFTDGSEEGTVGVHQLLGNRAILQLGNAGLGDGRVVFNAQDTTHGQELWVSDGTAEGTQLLLDLTPGSNGAYPNSFTPMGDGRVLFLTQDMNEGGYDLWVTDGSAGGTQRVLNLPWWGSPVNAMQSLGNGKVVYLSHDNSAGNLVMWVSDGTAEGTQAIKDLNPYGSDSQIIEFTALGDGRALFASSDPVHGYELWITDGTSDGTRLVRDINVLAQSIAYWELAGEVPNRVATGTLQIDGTLLQGETLLATFVPALVDADGLGSLNYQWQVSANGTDGWEDLENATNESFTPEQTEVGAYLRVRVTYTDGRGFEESVVSASSVAPVNNVNDVPQGTVQLSGNEWVGEVLTATQDISDIDGLGPLSYDWQTYSSALGEWVSLQHGESSQWTVTSAAAGQSVRVVVRYLDGGETWEAVAAELARMVLNGLVSGDAAANLLMGTYGADALAGGAGNDVYLLNNVGDTVTERNNGGIDTLLSYVGTLLMPAYVENTVLAAEGLADVTGNALDNLIIAGMGDNRIDGGAGKDTVSYESANVGVSVRLHLESQQYTGGSGLDALIRVESLVGSTHGDQLYGNTGANLLRGGEGDDMLSGDSGDDVLSGGPGADVMLGGAGKDWFVFDSLPDATAADVIYDFVNRTDKIVLDDDVFTALSGSVNGTTLSKTAFFSGLQATSASHRVIYDITSGEFYYDADGTGSAPQVLLGLVWGQLSSHPQLNFSDILVIA